MVIYQTLIYVVYSFFAPIITSGGGFLVSNVTTLTGVSLITAAGMTSAYFMVNGVFVVITFWKNIIWTEVRQILPLAALGSVFGALFLSRLSPSVLLALMLYFALRFLYEGVFKKGNGVRKEPKLSTWSMALLSGFLAGTALPGGGLRNSYLLSKGHSLSEMHGTTNFIGIVVWTIKLSILFEASLLTYKNFEGVLFAAPFLLVSNILLRKGLLTLPKEISRKISIFAMALFSVYAIVALAYALF